ncbi:hypothetical protein COBT_003173, partial [Conglomerata obtusa]
MEKNILIKKYKSVMSLYQLNGITSQYRIFKIFLFVITNKKFITYKLTKLIGAHLSVSKGLHTIQSQMDDLNATTCALFLRNPRGFHTKPLTQLDIKKWHVAVNNPNILLPHAPYIINLANKDNFAKHHACLEDDLEKC